MKRFWILLLLLHSILATATAQESPLERADRSGANPSTPVRKPGQRGLEQRREKPFSDPRRWLFVTVVAFLVIGGGRRWLAGRRGLKMAERLAGNQATVDEIRTSHQFGRVVVPELFRILSEGATAELRLAALEALVRLWRADELIPEEEKAILTRSFIVDWQIRRKYPRLLTGPIQIRAFYGPPSLPDQDLNDWLMSHLRWSHRVAGTRHAAHDAWENSGVAPPRVQTQVIAEDFPEDGSHRLMLHVRVKTWELTDNWELDLPAQSTAFEWDDHLKPGALATLPDDDRAVKWKQSIAFHGPSGDDAVPIFVQLDEQFSLRNPPLPGLALPLPCDLAHRVYMELKEVPGRFQIGEWVESSQAKINEGFIPKLWPDRVIAEVSGNLLAHGGRYLMRIQLEPAPERGWSDPMVRAVWPEPIATDWVEVDVVRR